MRTPKEPHSEPNDSDTSSASSLSSQSPDRTTTHNKLELSKRTNGNVNARSGSSKCFPSTN